ncbi:MAG TPA: ATP-binding cassette domain-containing protein [Candidatus Polarisedimenticolia bacterium]|nr:ATP-binding cassette domain-containing protein [Candidatus Polarisedimenticolia bacterium]
MNALELRGVTKTYAGKTALEPLDLAVASGRVCGLLGPNGAGKTTAIRMITGILLPDAGSVALFGEPFRPGHRRRIGYLPEEHGLYPKMPMREHLEFLAALQGVPAARRKAGVSDWIDRLKLGPWRDRKIEELSKGTQQKVQFIATVLHDPELLILDEPFSGLDPSNTKLLKDIVLEFVRRGRAVLLSTHRMEQVERMCDDICLIDKGRKVAGGPLGEVKRRYGRNTVQISFEGDASFLERLPAVERVDWYPNYVEARLRDPEGAQSVFDALAGRLRVRRFELGDPSINDIFIDLTGGEAPAQGAADESGAAEPAGLGAQGGSL